MPTPKVADRIGNRRADADRRHHHDNPREPEHRLGEALGERQQRPALLVVSIASAMAKITLNTTICSICASATARAMFCGKICSTMSCHVRGAGCGTCGSAGGGRTMSSPARLIEIATQPMSNANVVTTSK